jgi:iron complex outermembrane receptor protein
MNTKFRTELKIATGLLGVLLWVDPASAQSTLAAADKASAGSDSTGLQEIIVTAQKRSESAQDVPATVSVLGQEDLETRQIQSLSDLQSQVPSLVVGDFFGTNLITLRGISTGVTSGLEDPSVATHINGVYQPRARSIDSAMVDLERVEVISGPQGTLYGRNATGGAVNYVLRGPSSDFEGEVNGRVASYERFGVSGSISSPLAEGVGIRVTGLFDNQDKGFTKVLNANAPTSSIEDNKSYGGRVILRLDPASNLRVDLEQIYLNNKSSTVFSVFEPPRNNGAILLPQFFGAHGVYTTVDPVLDSRYWQSIATVTLDLSDNVSLKSISAYQNYAQDMTVDNQGSADQTLRGPIIASNRSKTFTQEFNLNASLLDGRLSSIFGLYYFDDDLTVDTDIRVGPAAFDLFSRQRAKSYAVFTDHTFSVTDNLRLIAGIRYNTDRKEATQSAFRGGTTVVLPLQTNQVKFTAWTPRFGFQYDINPEVMLYGQYSKGFKAGGFVANVFAVNSYEPERIEGGEIGFKSELFDRRLRLNVASYYYDYSNLQVNASALVNGVPNFRIRNAASSEIYGVEGQVQFALSESLKFDVAGMVQSAKYVDFNTCNNTAFTGACGTAATTTFINVKGNWLNRAAPYSLNVGLEYTAPAFGGEMKIRGESFFSGRVHYDEYATPVATQGAYSLQNLFVSYTPDSNAFTLRAYVKNIGETDYKTSAFYQTANRQYQGTWGAPRTYGLEASVRF